ncbi:MAG: glycosyltransferase family 4 protein [Bacteroidota bacterium]
MNIAFLTSEYPHPLTGASGGIGTSIKNLGQSLTEAGHAVYIYVYGQPADDTFKDGMVTIKRIRNKQLKGLSWWLTRKKIERILNEDIQRLKLDIVEVPDWTGISAWMNLNCPVVMRLNGSDTFFCNLENRKVKKWNKLQEQTAYKQADGIIAVSDFVGSHTNNIFANSRNYTIIPNGIQTSLFNSNERQPANQTVLYFGTLIRKKGVLELPAIFNSVHQQLQDTRFILIGADASDISTGSSSTWELMKGLFSESTMANVSFRGKVPYTDIQSYIEQATVCVFPSYAEACPVSWLEAMAMGKAIVASDIGWAPELIRHGQEGLLCAPENHTAFAAAIVTILNNPDMRTRFGSQARQRCISVFDSSIVAQQSVTYYHQLIHGI